VFQHVALDRDDVGETGGSSASRPAAGIPAHRSRAFHRRATVPLHIIALPGSTQPREARAPRWIDALAARMPRLQVIGVYARMGKTF